MSVGPTDIVTISIDFITYVLALTRRCLVRYALGAKLGIVYDEFTCTIITHGMLKEARVCG